MAISDGRRAICCICRCERLAHALDDDTARAIAETGSEIQEDFFTMDEHKDDSGVRCGGSGTPPAELIEKGDWPQDDLDPDSSAYDHHFGERYGSGAFSDLPRLEGLVRFRGGGDGPEDVLYGPRAHE